MVSVGNSQCGEHSQLFAIRRVGFVGKGTHPRIEVCNKLQNIVRIAAAQGVRLTENLDLHARVSRLLSLVHSKPPVTSSFSVADYIAPPVRSTRDTSFGE